MQMIQKNVVLKKKNLTHCHQFIAIQAMRKMYLMFFKQLRCVVNYLIKYNEFILITNFFTQVDLIIEKTDDYIVYQANDQNLIEEQMISDEAVFSWNKLISYFWKQKDFKLDPFQPSCFSIKTNSDFKIKIHSNGKAFCV